MWPAFFQSIARSVADIIFPVECVGCSKGGTHLCGQCLGRVQFFSVHFCHYCKKPQAFGQTCADCLKQNALRRLDGLYIFAPYDQRILKDAIHAWKYERVQEIGDMLGTSCAQRLSGLELPFKKYSKVIPVPLARQKQFDRGFNQAAQFARAVSGRLGISYQDALLRLRNTSSQFALPKSQRKQNVRNAFATKKDANLQNASILLVDDVTTTGATLEEACRALKTTGVKNVYGIALAHGA